MSSTQPKPIFKSAILSRVFSFVGPYRFIFWINVFLGIFLAFATPIRPYLIQATVNLAIGKQVHLPQWVHWILPNEAFNSVVQLILAISLFQVAFIVLETMFRFCFTYGMSWLGQQVIRDLRNKVYQKIMYWEMRQFDKTPIGTLTTRTINDIESINDIFSDGLIPIIADLLTIVFTLGTMFWINWQLTLVSLAPFPIMIIATYFFKESVNKSFVEVRNAVASLNAFIQEHLSGMAVVQAFAAEGRELTKFKKINAEHRLANIKAIFAYSVFFPIVEVVLAISTGLLVWFIAGNALDAGLLMSFILYLNQLFRPLRVIADKFNVLQMGMVAAERVFKVMDNPDQMPPTIRSIGPGGFVRQNPGEQSSPPPPAPPRRLVPARPSPEIADKTSLLDLNDRICKWPLGHPGEPDFHFCGDMVNPGFPYCVNHCSLAYQAQMPRRDRKPLPFAIPGAKPSGG